MDRRRTGRGALRILIVLAGMALAANAGAEPRHGRGHAAHGVHQQFGGHRHFHHHRHHARPHVGVWLGSSWSYGYGPGWYGDPWYRPYAYPYGSPAVVVQAPPVYIEQGGVPTAQMWYYCARPQGYYPYINSCATPWRAVQPGSVR